MFTVAEGPSHVGIKSALSRVRMPAIGLQPKSPTAHHLSQDSQELTRHPCIDQNRCCAIERLLCGSESKSVFAVTTGALKDTSQLLIAVSYVACRAMLFMSPSCGGRCGNWVRLSMVIQRNSHELIESAAEIAPKPPDATGRFRGAQLGRRSERWEKAYAHMGGYGDPPHARLIDACHPRIAASKRENCGIARGDSGSLSSASGSMRFS